MNRMKIIVVIWAMLLAGCSSGNLDQVKLMADDTFKENGFSVVGYQGYQWGKLGFNNYGGAYVWYTIKKDSNGIVYEAALQRWGSEYHIYSLKAVDAIKP